MKAKNVIIPAVTLLGGAAIGVTAGLLFAPHKGEITRKRLGQKAQEATNSLKNKIDDFNESLEGKVVDLEGKVKHKVKK